MRTLCCCCPEGLVWGVVPFILGRARPALLRLGADLGQLPRPALLPRMVTFEALYAPCVVTTNGDFWGIIRALRFEAYAPCVAPTRDELGALYAPCVVCVRGKEGGLVKSWFD